MISSEVFTETEWSRDIQAKALRDAARALDQIGDGELDIYLTSKWLLKRAARIDSK